MAKVDKIVYFDHASATPIDPEVLKTFVENTENNFANPNSIHSLGRKSKYIYNSARDNISNILGCEEGELIFTSSSTQSNYIFFTNAFKTTLASGGNFLISPLEHDSIADLLIPENVEIRHLNLDQNGRVIVDSISDLVDENTKFISLIHCHNEIGTVQNVSEISKKIALINQKRANDNQIYFHIDATQSPVFYDLNVQKLGVDSLTIGSQKMYSPRGASILYLKKSILISKNYQKNSFQDSLVLGTPNIAAISAFSKALSLCEKRREADAVNIGSLRDYLIDEVSNFKQISLNIDYQKGDYINFLPNLISFSIENFEVDYILTAFDIAGFCLSSGSACSSGSSRIPKSLKFLKKPGLAHIRISLGRSNTKEEIDGFYHTLDLILKQAEG